MAHDLEHLRQVCSALGEATRWQILGRIAGAELSASALAESLPVSRQAIAKHLAALGAAGLVSSKRVGRELRYSARADVLSEASRHLGEIADAWTQRTTDS
ncbi:metalloregulator ArsR/SmtB family transcription factor [Agreia sp. VKM Ac-1783]|uniref:ArsR/SmtB family transcription factor n=1 Tax=Agreia sp. VKM Ac-1783 TaxID=1938889 RepID=UPI000A2AE9DF|nr:metalloregulator ArsR/SmtB family transcription factor [Agreia sp. VKM Ac-1783]SMQ67369.1 transcriptional regulator, ArsR family [Agreia sp. VKM Ac-1783]